MSTIDSKDESADAAPSADALAETVDSGARLVADSGADTVLADASTESLAEPGGDSLLGTTLAERYHVTAKIGQGGMGAVYEAKHTVIGKRVAVKVLLDKHASKDQIVARLKREARLASSIGHENIIDITDFGTTASGRTFVVMEYLEGKSLGEIIAHGGRIEGQRAIRIARQIASALCATHDKGVVHRDIKPDNIFVIDRDGDEFIKVLDFGISRSLTPEEDEDIRLTQTGMVLGTPLYMSPEQAQGDDDLDHRIDIYALGVILYESVTGEVPFRGKNYLSILAQVIGDTPKEPSELLSGLDRDLESVICKAMAKDRNDRYQTMDELASDLALLESDDPKSTSARISATRWQRKRGRSKRRYVGWLGAVVFVAGLSTIGVTMLMDEKPAVKAAPAVARVIDVDSGVKKTPDASLPAFEEAHIRLTSTPSGAKVFEGALQVCPATPCVYKPAKTGDQIELRVAHEGYEDGYLTVTPELHDQQTLPMELLPVRPTAKPPKGPRQKQKKEQNKDTSGTTRNTEPTINGDTIPNPHQRD